MSHSQSAPKKRIAVIGIPGKWSTEVLADRLEQATSFRLVISMQEVRLDTATKALWYKDINLCELDGLVVKKITQDYDRHMWDRIELLRFPEMAGVRVFSHCNAILQLVNRLGCSVTLAANNMPLPDTCISESIEEVKKAVNDFGEAVLKPMFSTKARGMTLLCKEQPDLEEQISTFKAQHPMMYVQKKATLQGWDLGMVFVGGKYLCTYARVAQNGSWNTTINSGGKYQNYQPDAALIALGQQAQAPFGLDFTTVDIALTDDGPIIFEVSAFGGFKGAQDGCQIDAAQAYCDHIIATLSKE